MWCNKMMKMMTTLNPIKKKKILNKKTTVLSVSSILSLLVSRINRISLKMTSNSSGYCAAYYIKSNGGWVHPEVDIDVCNELLIITWFGEADNLWVLCLNLVAEGCLSVKVGDLHPAVLSHFPGVQPPQRCHHRSLRDGMGDVGSVSHLQPVQYVPLHRL